MRKLVMILAAVAAVGIALPVATQSASAETVVIKKDRGHHYGWRNHRDNVVIIKKHRREGVFLREGRRHHDDVTVGAGVSVR